jgi:hypothetical protein
MVTSGFVEFEAAAYGERMIPPPLLHYDRWSGAHLAQGCRRLTSGFSCRRSWEMRVSRVDFSGPYQRCVRKRVQGVRDEMWLVSCGFEPAGMFDVVARSPHACARKGHAYALH